MFDLILNRGIADILSVPLSLANISSHLAACVKLIAQNKYSAARSVERLQFGGSPFTGKYTQESPTMA